MNICSKNVYFLHIPKTGGSYVHQGKPITPIINLGHKNILDNPNDFDIFENPLYYKDFQNKERVRKNHLGISAQSIQNKFIFSNIRNIFKWLVSFAGHIGCWNAKHNVGSMHYDYKYAQKGFDYYIKTIANRTFPYPSKKFLFTQLFSSQGSFIVDWLNYTDTLDNDLKSLAKFKNLKYAKKNKRRVGNNKDYRMYYTSDLIDLVYKTWDREIKLYNFDFDNNKQHSNKLSHLIKQPKLKYTWIDDKFELL